MLNLTVKDPQKFVEFGVRMRERYNSDKLLVNSLKIHPEGNTVAGTAPHIENYPGTDQNGSFNVEPEVTKAIVTKAAEVDLLILLVATVLFFLSNASH